jgi:hypothetical protein
MLIVKFGQSTGGDDVKSANCAEPVVSQSVKNEKVVAVEYPTPAQDAVQNELKTVNANTAAEETESTLFKK